MRDRHRALRIVMRTDATLSFWAPLLFVGTVPVLLLLGAPGWMVAATVLTLAVVLGGCGVVMAVVLALGAARGRLEFPDDVLEGLHVVGLDDESPSR